MISRAVTPRSTTSATAEADTCSRVGSSRNLLKLIHTLGSSADTSTSIHSERTCAASRASIAGAAFGTTWIHAVHRNGSIGRPCCRRSAAPKQRLVWLTNDSWTRESGRRRTRLTTSSTTGCWAAPTLSRVGALRTNRLPTWSKPAWLRWPDWWPRSFALRCRAYPRFADISHRLVTLWCTWLGNCWLSR